MLFESSLTSLSLFISYYQVICRKDFKVFKDKSDAINPYTDLNNRLTKMLLKWCQPGQKLAVGKLEYKTVIEARLVSVAPFFLVLSLNNL